MRLVTAGEVTFELMLEGGRGDAAYERLTRPQVRDSAAPGATATDSWIRTEAGWRRLDARGGAA